MSARPGPQDYEESLRRALEMLKRVRADRDAIVAQLNEPIAIVGMSCHFPGGANSPDTFWELLDASRDGVQPLAPRWALAGANPSDNAPRWAGLLTEAVDGFDAAFFGISPREARSLDPQQRLLLEASWEALEVAGLAPHSLEGSRTGVFIGAATADYRNTVARQTPEEKDAYAVTGNMLSAVAGRLSYTLGLHGPCMTIDTACSSSLVALHLACRSLRARESDLALAGGVNLLLSPDTMDALARTQSLSPDGRCRTFDAAANGNARGEGCGLVVLKRSSDAKRDGDHIWALIRGSAVNQDGRSAGLTAPNVLAQEAVLREALQSARIHADAIGYVETHGTGTSLGDPIEVEALRSVLGPVRPDGTKCVLGAVKTNLGHLEAAAGVAGLIKAVLSLRHECIPRNLHFRTLNPRIRLAGTALALATEPVPWPRTERPRLAGVSAFGMSGTNVHVVLEEAPAPEASRETPQRSAELLVLSAKSAAALDVSAARLVEHLQTNPGLSLADIAFSLATTRSPMEHRLAVAATSSEALRAVLQAAAQGQTPPGAVRGRMAMSGVPKVVFVFAGEGSHWLGMGRQLLGEEPVFRAVLTECDRAIQAEAGWSLLAELAATESSSRLHRVEVSQPALFAIEVALAALWRSWGVEPDAVVGHSLGEVAAAHVAGALSLADATAIICRRSRLLSRISGQGAMAVVELSLAEAETALHGYEDRLSVAASNSPRLTVLSGETDALMELLNQLEGRGVFCGLVAEEARHSPQVEPLRAELVAALAALKPQQAAVPMRSTVTGALVSGPELVGSYWGDNLRRRVRFTEAMQALLVSGHGLFVEMSAHPTLLPLIEESLRGAQREGVAVGSLRRGQGERAALLEALGALWARGYALAWEKLFPAGGRRVPLPTYPWQRERYWIEGAAAPAMRAGHRGGHPLLGELQTLSTQPSTRIWETTLDLKRLPWLRDQKVQSAVVFPESAYLEMVLSSAAEAFNRVPHQITDVVLSQALVLADYAPLLVQLVMTQEPSGPVQWQIASRGAGVTSQASWTVHGRGTLRREERGAAPAALELALLRARLGTARPVPAAFYEAAAVTGKAYGPAFQGIVELWQGEGEALGRVRLPQAAGSAAGYQFHPALLDACFQVLGGLFTNRGEAIPWEPVAMASLQLYQRPAGELWCYARSMTQQPQDDNQRSADLCIVDPTGAVVAEVGGLVVQRLASGARRREHDAWFVERVWEAVGVPAPKVNAGRWLLLGRGEGLGAALSTELEGAGHSVVHAAEVGLSVAALHELLTTAFAGRAPTGIVHLGSLDGGNAVAAETVEAVLLRGYDSVLFTVQALAKKNFPDAPRLWLVTQGAQPVGTGEVSVMQAPLLGLGRVIAMEHAELRCGRIDLDPSGPQDQVAALLAELLADDAVEELALRNGERRVARLVHRVPQGERREKGEGAVAAAGLGVLTQPHGSIRADGTYLVTGGLGGLGLSVAGWLAAQGAGHLVLLGRSGAASAGQQAAVDALAAKGTRVTVAKADVADRAELAKLLGEIPASGMPLRGVIHTAGVLADGLLIHQTPAQMRLVMAPKILGALHLHALTRGAALDFFVLYASTAGLFGWPGQGNYAAANTFLDALAHHRRAQGLPALSVDWGLFAEVGLAGAKEDLGALMAAQGIPSLTPEDGLSALGRLLASDHAQVGVVPLDAGQWERFSQFVAARHGAPDRQVRNRELLDRLTSAEAAARAALLETFLGEQVSQVLRIPVGKLAIDASFKSLGMDSLMGLELRNRVEYALSVTAPAALAWTYPTVAAMTRWLLDKLFGARPDRASVHVLRFRKVASPRARLFCFHGAGGSPEFFRTWADEAGWSDVDIVAMWHDRSLAGEDAPGKKYVQEAASLIQQYADVPFALVGLSFGVQLAMGTAIELASRPSTGNPLALFLLGGALVHPATVPGGDDTQVGAVDVFIERIFLHGASGYARSSEQIRTDWRADLAIANTMKLGWGHSEGASSAGLAVPVVAVGGTQDEIVPPAQVQALRLCTKGHFCAHFLPGDHTFLIEKQPELRQLIKRYLNTLLSGEAISTVSPAELM